MELATIKQYSERTGISEYTVRNMTRTDAAKPAIHKLTGGKTGKIQIDTEMFDKLIRSGAFDYE